MQPHPNSVHDGDDHDDGDGDDGDEDGVGLSAGGMGRGVLREWSPHSCDQHPDSLAAGLD